MTKDSCFYVGRIVKTHGIKGEVTLRIDNDDFDDIEAGEAAPEARPAGGALRARLIGESTASSVASLLGRRGGSRAQSRGKPCLHGAKWASSTAEL